MCAERRPLPSRNLLHLLFQTRRGLKTQEQGRGKLQTRTCRPPSSARQGAGAAQRHTPCPGNQPETFKGCSPAWGQSPGSGSTDTWGQHSSRAAHESPQTRPVCDASVTHTCQPSSCLYCNLLAPHQGPGPQADVSPPCVHRQLCLPLRTNAI